METMMAGDDRGSLRQKVTRYKALSTETSFSSYSGQKSSSRRSPLISSKPVSGPRAEALKGSRITSALPTTPSE
jgi:hypothetical protein